jgi:UPF0042 nucleotide-binding protein
MQISTQEVTHIELISFGYKHGKIDSANIVFDIRGLDNPFYKDELRDLTGNNSSVQEFVMGNADSKEMYQQILTFLLFYIPFASLKRAKSPIKIAIGCTGGKHRSVTFVNQLSKTLASEKNQLLIVHRDINIDD